MMMMGRTREKKENKLLDNFLGNKLLLNCADFKRYLKLE
jgi:hypothetical protein